VNASIRHRVVRKARRARQVLKERGQTPLPGHDNAPRRALTQVTRLRKRVAELEQEMQETRRLSRRVAELTDLVQELLLPAADRDEEKLRRLLDGYDAGR
jgi:hypothetical protein